MKKEEGRRYKRRGTVQHFHGRYNSQKLKLNRRRRDDESARSYPDICSPRIKSPAMRPQTPTRIRTTDEKGVERA